MILKRYALGLCYDGAAYHGWQHQHGLVSTVQECLEKAVSRVANHPVLVTCAGRTDAGVHASAQVVHFDTEADRSEHSWIFGVNSNLPRDISVTWAKEVPPHFHARYSAVSRKYRYLLINQPVRPSLFHQHVGWHHRELDEQMMQEAAQFLLGEHDFSAFRGASCQSKSPVRTLYEVKVQRQGRSICVDVHGNAFLLHMVRNIVGVLIEIGSGQQKPEWMQKILLGRDRTQASFTASPQGLYLTEVHYPDEFLLPKRIVDHFILP